MDQHRDLQIPVRVIGFGNPHRRDDAVGLVVARLLKSTIGERVEFREEGHDALGLLEAWEGAETAFLLDAARSGSAPGTLHRLEAGQLPGSTPLFCTSTHSLGVVQAVQLGRRLNCLPPKLVIYAIEGFDFGQGAGLSLEVKRALPNILDRLRREVQAAWASLNLPSQRLDRQRPSAGQRL